MAPNKNEATTATLEDNNNTNEQQVTSVLLTTIQFNNKTSSNITVTKINENTEEKVSLRITTNASTYETPI